MQNNQAIPFNKENFKQILSKQFAWVILVSVPGALIAEYFNIPLAWFLGPMLVTSVVTLSGVKTKMPKLVLSTILIIHKKMPLLKKSPRNFLIVSHF